MILLLSNTIRNMLKNNVFLKKRKATFKVAFLQKCICVKVYI